MKQLNMKYNEDKIRTIVSDLKEVKTQSFKSVNGLTDFKKVTETCRIIDTFILPLYYIWEHYCHRQLKELDFEAHLDKPYKKFILNPLTNTWELYLFISIKKTFEDLLQNKRLSKELPCIYKEFIDNYIVEKS